MTFTTDALDKVHRHFDRMRSELGLWRLGRLHRDDTPRVLFFPSGPAEQAGLLRAHAMANALSTRGWHAATVPWTIKQAGRARVVQRFRPDLLVFQQCRHVLNDGALAFGIPYVVDTDDADFHLEIDGLQERLERTVRGAAGVIAGSRYLRDHHRRNNPHVAVIWTGTPISAAPWPRHAQRQADGPPILTWAQARPLDYVRELDFVVDLQVRLLAAGSRHRLRFYGIDTEAQRAELAARLPAGSQLEFRPTLGYAGFLESLREVAVGLSPIIAHSPFSRGKSFGKILGYLDAGVPIVASDAADHSLFFTPASGIVSNDPTEWARAVTALLADPDARDAMAGSAGAIFRERLGIDAAARETDRFLRGLLPTGIRES